MKNLKELNLNEMISINGGGLVEDIGCAYRKIECAVSDAYNKVKSWFK